MEKILNPSEQEILFDKNERYVASRGFFSNYPMEKVLRENQSFMLLGSSDHLWAHFFGDSTDDLVVLAKSCLEFTSYFYSVEDWMIPVISSVAEMDWIMKTERYLLSGFTHVIGADHVGTVSPEMAPYIYSHSGYSDYTSVAYIQDRLRSDISAGIKMDGKLVAWGLTHDDGALGFLHVLPEYRGKGFGEEILNALINRKIKARMPVFCNIVPGNQAPLHLMKKLGFHFERNCSWIKLRNA